MMNAPESIWRSFRFTILMGGICPGNGGSAGLFYTPDKSQRPAPVVMTSPATRARRPKCDEAKKIVSHRAGGVARMQQCRPATISNQRPDGDVAGWAGVAIGAAGAVMIAGGRAYLASHATASA